MKRYLLLLPILLLSGCAGMLDSIDPEVQEGASNIIGKILSGDTSGAIGTGIDLLLLLLGFKGLQKGGKLVKESIINKPQQKEAS